MPWLILLIEFLVLFTTSRFLFNSLFALFLYVFRSQKMAIFLVSLFFFPGVLVHELSHLLCAWVLLVKTHKIEFVPQLNGTSLKMGSVQVEKSDIIRSLLIGVAPLIFGSSIIVGSLFFLGRVFSYAQIFSSFTSFLVTIGGGYIIFVIANTMFSSKKDIEGLFELLILASIFISILYLIGIRPHEFIMPLLMQIKVVKIIERIVWLILLPVVINIVITVLSYPLIKKLRMVP